MARKRSKPVRNQKDHDSPATVAKPKTALSRRRLWLFRVVAGVFIPCFVLLALEVLLRLFGFGYTTAFLVPCETERGEALCTNLKATWSYFPPEAARQPISLTVAPVKQEDTYRIFVLGASAAQGDPQPAFSFARILEVMLEHRFPSAKFEVINTAITAINSHVVRDIARDCAQWDPDLFIVYLGNNEVVGPFGPSSVFAPLPANFGLRRAAILVKQTRVAQLLHRLVRTFGDSTPSEWGGMAMFLENQIPWNHVQLPEMYENFRANLEDIYLAAVNGGARIALCTVATNLRDCSPFASLHKDGLSATALEQWEAALAQGQEAEGKGDLEPALVHYNRAAAIDAEFAELPYRLGTSLLSLGRADEAYEQLARARDLDTLRFRADSRINQVIRETGAQYSSQGMVLIDAARDLAAQDRSGIPGEEMFFEHVHLTFHGNYLLAKSVFVGIEELVADALGEASASSQTPFTEAQCAEALAFTDWDRLLILEDMVNRLQQPPFTHQSGHAARMDRYLGRLADMKRRTKPEKLPTVAALYDQAISARKEDAFIHFNYAMLLGRGMSRFAQAEASLRRVVAMVPQDVHAWCVLADVVSEQGRHAEAVSLCRKALQVDPLDYTVYSRLGRFLGLQGQLASAIEAQEKAITLKPVFATAHRRLLNALRSQHRIQDAIPFYSNLISQRPRNTTLRIHLGQALAETGQIDRALDALHEVLRLEPDSAEAHLSLARLLVSQDRAEAAVHFRKAGELAPDRHEPRAELGDMFLQEGRYGDAAAAYENVIRLDPDMAAAHYMLGYAREQEGRIDDAVGCYERAIELAPTLADAHERLGGIAEQRERFDDAARFLQEAARLKPEDPFVHHKLAMALSRAGRIDEAIAALRAVVRLKPDHFESQLNLGSLLLLENQPDAALPVLSEAARLRPDDSEVHHKLGVASFQVGRVEEAIHECRRAVQLDATNVKAFRNLAAFLLAAGRKKEAEVQLEAALRLDPSHEPTSAQLDQLRR